jgi:ABC-2 type transport system ATP-binding protein
VCLGSREPWAAVGYLVETARCYPELSVLENLEVARRLHPGTPPAALGRMVERLGLARALLHAPRPLLLDEPANGLDPAGIVEIRELLRSLADTRGTTVFVSSHILVEVAHLADRIGIVHNGRLVEELDRAALVAAARAFSAEQLTEQQRADALLTLELERYFLARTDGSLGR